MKPLVSVLMSVHNEPAEFIKLAVGSICNQTYDNLEFIIIDDASEAGTYKFLEDLEAEYDIIRLYRNEQNIGLTATLNHGVSLCTGQFIARMDADDYSLPDRIQKQVDFFDKHPETDILGCGVVTFGQTVTFMSPVNGYSNEQVQCELFFTSSLCHPSVMIKKKFLAENQLNYDAAVKKGQDFDLWERSSIYGNLAVLPDVLLYYRIHANQITSTGRNEQNTSADMIMRRRLRRIGLNPTDREMACHLSLKGQMNEASLDEIKHWIDKMLNHANGIGYINTKVLADSLRKRLLLAKLRRHVLPGISEINSLCGLLHYRLMLKSKVLAYRKKVKFLKSK